MADQASEPKRVLVTGSTGAIGKPVAEHLKARGHFVRGFARNPSPWCSEYVVGDLAKPDDVNKAVEGMDVVVHLGAFPDRADFIKDLLGPNVIGLYNICEAAANYKVQRLSLASSVQTVSGRGDRESFLKTQDGYWPSNNYALTKVWAEVAGEMYARMYDLSVVNVRIGWLPRDTEGANVLRDSQWGADFFFSHADAQRFYERVVESPTPLPGEAVTVFAVSRPTFKQRLDPELPREVLGYEPQDKWPDGLNFEYSVE